MNHAIRKLILVAALTGTFTSISGCTLGKNDDNKGSIYKNDNGQGSGGSSDQGNR